MTENFLVEIYPTSALTCVQQHSRVKAFYLAILATTMTRPKKDDATNATSATAKAPYKRKRKPGEERFYAVRSGRVPGVYSTWADCQAMINGFAGAQCKLLCSPRPQRLLPTPDSPPSSDQAFGLTLTVTLLVKAFPSREEAALFAAGKNPNPGTVPDRFYAVAVGNRPGIYTEWTDAQAAYTGVKAPKYKKFDTREAAEQWMGTFVQETPSITFGGILDEEDEEEDDILPSGKRIKNEMQVSLGGDGSGDLEEIYTDGSTLSNGQEGAVAGVGVFFGDGDPRFVQHSSVAIPAGFQLTSSPRTGTSPSA